MLYDCFICVCVFIKVLSPYFSSQKLSEGLSAFIDHVANDVVPGHAQLVHGGGKYGQTETSSVVLDEVADKMKLEYKSFLCSPATYKWQASKGEAPGLCPLANCALLSDSEASDGDDPKPCGKERHYLKCHTRNQIKYGFNKIDHNVDITPNLNMSRMFNLLWLLPHFIPGFHSSYLYIAQVHSMFSVHVEDTLTWSVNYLHHGHPKVW